jgi:hypothetical protein
MIEASISAAIALISGLGFMTQKLHNRISELDHRIDDIELRVVSEYITKDEFATSMKRLEESVFRIEGKIDNLIFKRTTT